MSRRLPVGAEPQPDGGTHFRVWAPIRRRVEVVLESTAAPVTGALLDGPVVVPLEAEPDGYFSGVVPQAQPGALYRFRLDDEGPFPDPASRFQPSGPHGPSQVIDAAGFAWQDARWRGPDDDAVLYELHVGTFTPGGTWSAAQEKLPQLAELGVTVLEVLPVTEFAGAFGWGYDGVALFAPFHGYGAPADMRRFVDAAHALGLGVILDVVYNHLGPDGNYLPAYTDRFLSRAHATDWGDGINFDGPGSEHVRAFYLANARHWIEEYHLDGFRFDATQDIHDDGGEHILRALAREARAAAAGRSVLLVAENEPQDTRLVRSPEVGGYGLDMLWNDDFHHSAVVALTGRSGAYYSDYLGAPQEFVSAAKHGFLYQGQWYRWQEQRRGTPTRGLPRRALVHYLENHDQVANSERGLRLHDVAAPGAWRALVAVQLLLPQTPLLFQGQEFASSAPFLFFADHRPELAARVRRGRRAFLTQFPNLAVDEVQRALPNPDDPATFARCKLDWTERERNGDAVALHRDLLRLRRDDPTLARVDAGGLDGAVLTPDAFLIRWFARGSGLRDRLLLVNLGRDLHLAPVPEPLLAPPPGAGWALLWSSEDPAYGGRGTPAVEDAAWHLPGQAAVLLVPVREGEE